MTGRSLTVARHGSLVEQELLIISGARALLTDLYNKMKNKKYHPVGTVPKYHPVGIVAKLNCKFVERGNTQMNDISLCLLGTPLQ